MTYPQALTLARQLRARGLNPPVSDEVWAESIMRWDRGR
jgi:hypothetical protein